MTIGVSKFTSTFLKVPWQDTWRSVGDLHTTAEGLSITLSMQEVKNSSDANTMFVLWINQTKKKPSVMAMSSYSKNPCSDYSLHGYQFPGNKIYLVPSLILSACHLVGWGWSSLHNY